MHETVPCSCLSAWCGISFIDTTCWSIKLRQRCWESTNQEHHSVEGHRWPGNEVAVNHFVPVHNAWWKCLDIISLGNSTWAFQLTGWGASGRQLEDPAGSPGDAVANSTSEFTWLHFSCKQCLRYYLGLIRILPSQSQSCLLGRAMQVYFQISLDRGCSLRGPSWGFLTKFDHRSQLNPHMPDVERHLP